MKTTLRTDSDRQRYTQVLAAQEMPLEVTHRPYKSKRSLDQNALYWKWLSVIKNHIYESTGDTFTEDDLHDYYREQFLPVIRKTINKTDIKRLTSTTKLKVADMSEYMQKIDERCITKMGLMLPTTEV